MITKTSLKIYHSPSIYILDKSVPALGLLLLPNRRDVVITLFYQLFFLSLLQGFKHTAVSLSPSIHFPGRVWQYTLWIWWRDFITDLALHAN